MTIVERCPVPPMSAHVAVLTIGHLRLLSRVDALAVALQEGLLDGTLPDVNDAIAELRAMSAEARKVQA